MQRRRSPATAVETPYALPSRRRRRSVRLGREESTAPGIRNEAPIPTRGEIELLPGSGGATLVDFRHYGFRDGELWSTSQKWFTRAWQDVLEGLDRACQKDPKVARAPL